MLALQYLNKSNVQPNYIQPEKQNLCFKTCLGDITVLCLPFSYFPAVPKPSGAEQSFLW